MKLESLKPPFQIPGISWTVLAAFSLLLVPIPSLSQEKPILTFSPSHPTPSQSIQFCYRPNNAILKPTSRLRARIFFTTVGEAGSMVNPPFELEVVLDSGAGTSCGRFDVPDGSVAIMMTFMDSLDHLDNNDGKGYWSPLYNGNDPLPGSLSSIAELFAQGWPARYNLKEDKEYAQGLYESDFKLNPVVKRHFARNYLTTFDTQDGEDIQEFRNELFQFTQYRNLSDWDLLAVKRYYTSIGETDSASKYDARIFERRPPGAWAILANTLKLAVEIEGLAELDEKWKKYLQFKQLYGSNYPDATTRRRMQDRTGQILRGMVLGFSERGDLKIWEAEVDALDEGSRFYTYRRTAVFVSEKVKASFQMKGNWLPGSIKPESPLWQSTTGEEELLRYAEWLARESCQWYRKRVSAPRDSIDLVQSTNQEIKSMRALQLSLALDALSQTLVLQQKPAEALEVLREAVKLNSYGEPEINEHFIALLVQTNNIEEARRKTSQIVRMSKSTPAIQEFYKVVVKDSTSRVDARKDVHKKLKEEMLHEVLPEVNLIDANGQTTSLAKLKGKTIILDFWATWCAPCIFGMEFMATVVDQHKDRDDVVFMFVNIERVDDNTKQRVSKRLSSLGYDFDIYFDLELRASKQLKVSAIPTLIVIDPKGKIRFRHTGIMMTRGKQQLIDELIAMIELSK